jgi:tryptophan synthase alpha chain
LVFWRVFTPIFKATMRIKSTFEALAAQQRKALIPFITAGHPRPEMTVPLMQALVAGGANIIELGVPFSDPMADGPVIQKASEKALAQGMSLAGVFDLVRLFRQSDETTPIVLMGYANPIEAMGVERFAKRASEAGVDGVLVVDYPPEEAAVFAHACKTCGLDPIFLLAPTSSEARFADVAPMGSGYLYYVSLKGVTGSAHLDLDAIAQRIPAVKKAVGLPVGIGFGIRDAATARAVAALADAVVIGSRLIELIDDGPEETACARAHDFIAKVRQALDAPEGEPL